MEIFEYGERDADNVLIQMIDDHGLRVIEAEAEEIRKSTDVHFCLLGVKVDSWMRELSPWPAPSVFANEGFGDGAGITLQSVLSLCSDRRRNYYIGGYSLAGLFALWSSSLTDMFKGVAAASPSVWFPCFTDFLKNNPLRTQTVYLSLGDRESKTRNKTMATVSERILECRNIILSQGVDCYFEWNNGGHFQNPEKRTAAAFSYLLDSVK